MKIKNLIILLLFIVGAGACIPKHLLDPATGRVYPGYQLFSEAEKAYQNGAYIKALSIYQDYIVKFPKSPMAPASLMKIGSIYSIQGNHERARAVYQRVMGEYPGSPFALDSMVAMLASLLRQGNFKEVIEKAPLVLQKTDSELHVIKIYSLLGDASMAIDATLDAAFFYSKAHRIAAGGSEVVLVEKFKAAVAKLDPDDINSISSHSERKPSFGYLLYQMGVFKDESGQHNDALWLMNKFIELFPDHEKVPEAEKRIEKFSTMALYNRYTIGCLLPLSGPYEVYGRRALKGVEFALTRVGSPEVNPLIKVVVKDTGSDDHTAALAVEELINENQVAAIIGPIRTAESAASAAQSRGVPLIAITQKENIADMGDYIFRNFFTPKMQIDALVAYAMEQLGLNRFAVLYPNDSYGKTFMNLFWDAVLKHEGSIVGIESYQTDQTDFGDSIKKLTGLYGKIPKNRHSKRRIGHGGLPGPIIDFDAIFIPDEPKRAGLIIPQLAFYDVNEVYLLGTNLWHSEKMIRMAHRYAQSAIMPDIFFAGSEKPQVRSFVKGFEEIYEETPGFIEAIAYDIAMILFRIVSRPDIMFRSAFRDELLKLQDYPGVAGTTSFESNGEVRRELYILKIKDETFIELGHP